MLSVAEALDIVVELASQNVLDDDDMPEEVRKQKAALDVVGDFIANVVAEDRHGYNFDIRGHKVTVTPGAYSLRLGLQNEAGEERDAITLDFYLANHDLLGDPLVIINDPLLIVKR